VSDANETRAPFQFSLRTFLIVTSVVGIGAGLLGRLLLRDPQQFAIVVGLLSTIGPFLLAIGTIVWLGSRQRRRRLVFWGVLLLLTPVVGIAATFLTRYFLGPMPNNLRMQSIQQLIAQDLPKKVDEPWVWQELEYRLKNKKMSQHEVDDAIKALVLHMTTTAPSGWNRPLSWQQEFLKSATQAGMISQPAMFSLCDAFFGPNPVLKATSRERAGSDHFQIEIDYGSVWGNQFVPEIDLLWQVKRVLLDGKPIALQPNGRFGQHWSGTCSVTLPVGEHQVTVEVECAYIDRRKLIGLDSATLPRERWPQVCKQWTQSVSAPLTVHAVGAPLVALITGPDQDPGPAGGMKISRFVVQPNGDGKSKIILVAEFTDALLIPVSYDVTTIVKGQSVSLGQVWIVHSGSSTTRGGNLGGATVAELDPSIKVADIILTPNPGLVEDRPDVTEIWGKKVILRRVPLERLDLETRKGAIK
jgi:hypothetical protein